MAGPEPKLRDVFSKALECQSAQEQASYLDQACQGDVELRARLEELLQAHGEAGSFLQEPSASRGATVDEPPVSEAPGTVIGPYKLLQQIGEGGMGTVFMAEQMQPVQRKVALKLIKPGMDSRQVIARFEAERQALAVMDHVNIARVFDVGTTEARRPYFVMELVHGVPITKYCDDNLLTPRERLELFVPVCQAIQHAHQKGIIHRDIKPSNVMVTLYDGKPVPKVIDFGVAKATEQRLTERTLFTQYGTMVGTLEYMSPEQAEMSALGIDTRSDIYSLGVLLYELLTGSTPLSHKRLKDAAYAEILRMIKEEEPPKPSTRLSDSGEALASISAQRRMEPAKLSGLVRGELDWIVMKCLEKDRDRRYETASGFAADVQHYLDDEPVLACPLSATYRLRKLVRKHRAGVLTAVAVMGLLLAGTAVSAWQAVRATRATEGADQQRQRAQGNLQIALKALDGIYLQIAEERLPRDPQRKNEDTELLKKALNFYQQFAQLNSADPAVRLEVSRAFRRVGDIQVFVGEHAAAQETYGLAIARAQELATAIPGEPEHLHELAVCHTSLAEALALTGQMPAATDHYRQSIALLTKLTADYPTVVQYRAELARGHCGLGKLDKRRGERGAAEQSLRQALDIQSKLSAEFPSVPQYRADLAQIHRLLGYWPEGSQWLPIIPEQVDHERQAFRILSNLVTEFPGVALHRYRLASTLQELATYAGPFTERNGYYNQAIPILTKLVADFPQVPEYGSALSVCYGNHGANYLTHGDWETAAKFLRMSVDLSTKLVAECPSVSHFSGQLATGTVVWAEVLIYRGELAEAGKSLEDAITRLQGCLKSQPNSSYYTQMLVIANYLLCCAIAPLGEAVEAAKRQQDADQVLLETGTRLLKDRGPFVAATFCADVAAELGIVAEGLKKMGRHQELTAICGAATGALSKAIEFDPTFAKAWTMLSVARYRTGDWKAAIVALEKSMELRKGGDGSNWFFLAMTHWQLGDRAQARKWYDRAVQWMERNKPQDDELRRFHSEAAELLGVKEESGR